ncbi:MAG: FAD-dependent monooxygenase [Bacteroidia bacterium]|nr:FAD-dependent monooxygenase [Bacteroidia bacterium]
MGMSQKVTIIGAGLVGSLLSIYLSKRGYKVSVYEKRPDLRKNRISAGKSINLALSDRGWRGLEGVGIADEIRKVAIPMKGRMIHNMDGEINFQPYGKEGEAIYSVSRGGLNCLLMDLAEKHGAEFFYNKRCTNIDFQTATSFYENTETKKITTVKSERIFGTDGAFSSARLQLQLSTDKFNYSQQYLEHGYKELVIPETESGEFAMEPNALHIWPRGKFMLIALPNLDKSYTCTLFFPFEGEQSFSALDTKEKMFEFFSKTFPDAVSLMPTLQHDYFAYPAASLVTVKCFPWSYEDKLLLLGDAAHAIVPFFGQGMNCGFEDCVILDQLINNWSDDWRKIFSDFEAERKKNSDAIAELAVENFVEMRELVGHPEFLLRKKIEAYLHEHYPEKWKPLYSMVTFSDIPYNTAYVEGKKQDEIMKQIMSLQNISETWQKPETLNRILSIIERYS